MLYVRAQLRLDRSHPAVSRMRGTDRARLGRAALQHESLREAMKLGSVEPARCRELKEIPDVLRRPLRMHFQLHRSESGLEGDGSAQLIGARGEKRFEFLRLDGDLQ